VNANAASSLNASKLKSRQNLFLVHLLDGMGREAMVASDAALLASGTAAWSAGMLVEMPDGGGISHEAFTFWLAKRLVKTDYVLAAKSAGGQRVSQRIIAGRV
jgi:lipid-A-disaccharide synthase